MTRKVVSLANIGTRGRRRRLTRGLVLLAVGTAVVVLDLAVASRWWLVAVFALFGGGALDVLQAVGHT
jgi:fatty acid desaturase